MRALRAAGVRLLHTISYGQMEEPGGRGQRRLFERFAQVPEATWPS